MSGARDNEPLTFRPQTKLDEELQREVDEALGGMSLEDLIDVEAKASDAAQGQEEEHSALRRGRVIAVHGEDIFVDLGGKDQGILKAGQFADEPLPVAGDQIEVAVHGYDEADGLLLLALKGAANVAAWETLEVGQDIEGRVTALNTGGLELKADGIRAFMPISQIELSRVNDLKPYVDQKMRCRVIEIKRSEGGIIVSRRAVLEEEMAKLGAETIALLEEGQIVSGVVKNIMPYGAFVDIGGVDGLLHVADMSWARVDSPSNVVTEGQQLQVKVLKIDREAQRISLGLKQVAPSPWEDAQSKWPVDEVVAGRITRLADFGAFVELAEGLEGLIPISELSFERRIAHPSKVVNVGDVVKVRVLSVDTERQRISLSLKRVGDDPWIGASHRWPADSVVDGIVSRLTEFGAFVELTPGVEGLVHISEFSHQHVRAAGDVVSEGQTVQAKVLSVDEDRRRISLSIKALAAQQAAQDQGGQVETTPPPPPNRKKKPLRGGLDHPGGGLTLGNL
ncbi:MAG: S1 RNA-binding domain-containing protein [Planctomycetes bacterium]|nr:S1 RNA-binding domain-containing protein [Planctomycetota bacterium]